ncbi:hypothetical protein H9Q73_001865 [Fusarium xylarioides]|nr:hypothetical protein H9Q73_001865 [Fusarium xylarioides]
MEYPANDTAAPLIKLSDMAQRREIRTASEDWTGITSSAKRRKLQNRLNQRAYERRKVSRRSASLHPEQGSRPRYVTMATADTSDAPEPPHNLHYLSMIKPPSGYTPRSGCLLLRSDAQGAIREFVKKAYEDYVLGCPQPWYLSNLIQVNVFNALVQNDRDAKDLCVIGAGFIGIEVAENFRKLGLDVSIVEYGSHVFPPIDGEMAEILHSELRDNGIHLFLNESAQKIDKSLVTLSCGLVLPADLVILAAGVRARTGLAKQAGLVLGATGVSVDTHMQTSDPDIYAVGDMAETQNNIMEKLAMLALAGPANRQGRMATDHIYGKAVNYRGNVGASVCQVFGLTLGFVGLSTQALRQLGHDPLSVTVHSHDHAGYFPGSQTMTIRLAFRKETGHIMGAQIIGKGGVDKRIDVLATAIQFGSTVFDLEHLELGYAPPYGSAKDAVNMAGFVASNVLRGDCKIVQAEQLTREKLDKLQVVDVRSAEEFVKINFGVLSGWLPRLSGLLYY